jgi:hypothetical protein
MEWWRDRRVWANVLTILVGALTGTGVITEVAGSHIINLGPDVLIGLSTVISGLLVMYAQFTQKTKSQKEVRETLAGALGVDPEKHAAPELAQKAAEVIINEADTKRQEATKAEPLRDIAETDGEHQPTT